MADKKYTVKQGDTLESIAKTFYNGPDPMLNALGKIKPDRSAGQCPWSPWTSSCRPDSVSIGPSETDGDKTVKKVQYGVFQDKSAFLFPLPKEFQEFRDLSHRHKPKQRRIVTGLRYTVERSPVLKIPFAAGTKSWIWSEEYATGSVPSFANQSGSLFFGVRFS